MKYLLFFSLILLSACNTPRPAINAPTPAIITIAPEQRLTLPPTWTFAPTLTPLPTSIPQPTQTPAPTLTAAEICRGFGIVAAPQDGVQFDYDGKVTFGWRGVPDGVPMTLTITLHGQKAGARVDVNTPGDNLVSIPLTRLPQEGRYEWRIWLKHPQYGEICIYTGTFTRKPLAMM